MEDLYEYTKDLLLERLHIIPTEAILRSYYGETYGFTILWPNNAMTVMSYKDTYKLYYRNLYTGRVEYTVEFSQLKDAITLLINSIEPYKML